MAGFSQVDHQRAAVTVGEGPCLHQVFVADGVGRVGGNGRGDQRVALPGVHKALDAGHRRGVIGAVRGRKINQDLAQQAPQAGTGHLFGHRLLEVIHVADGADATTNQFGQGQPGASPYEGRIDVHRLGGEDRVLEPIIEILIVGEAAEQGHRHMGMTVDQARDHGPAGRVDPFAGAMGRFHFSPRAHGHDATAIDGDCPVGEHTAVAIHGHHDAARHQQIHRAGWGLGGGFGRHRMGTSWHGVPVSVNSLVPWLGASTRSLAVLDRNRTAPLTAGPGAGRHLVAAAPGPTAATGCGCCSPFWPAGSRHGTRRCAG